MSSLMKALVYEGPRDMNMRDKPIPEIYEDEVLIEVKFTGICGSELSGYLGHNSLRVPPLVMGHEFSGIIREIGHTNKPHSLTVGQGVTVNPLVSCRLCKQCLSGNQQLCMKRALLGAHLPGSYAQYVKVPNHAVYALPKSLSLETGALVEPLSCAVRIAELAKSKPTDWILILGMGPIGLFVLQAMRLYGVDRIIAVDMNEQRLDIARQFNAITLNPAEVEVQSEIARITGDGVQIAVDAVGANVTRQQCIQACSFGGKVIFTGLHEADATLPINDMIRKEISTFGSFAYSANNFIQALQWLSDGKVILDRWIERAPLEEGKACFEKLITNPGSIAKILLIP
jgi:threonine dehydrogenase-like Zn-dependent dehydrogenase